MKLTKRSSFNTKLSYFGILLILAIGSTTPAYAVNYHFEEDFSDSQLSGWEFSQVDFETAGNDVINTSTFAVDKWSNGLNWCS